MINQFSIWCCYCFLFSGSIWVGYLCCYYFCSLSIYCWRFCTCTCWGSILFTWILLRCMISILGFYYLLRFWMILVAPFRKDWLFWIVDNFNLTWMKIHDCPNFISHDNWINTNVCKSLTENIIPMSPTRYAIINNQSHNSLQSKLSAFNIKSTAQILTRTSIRLTTSSLNSCTHISSIWTWMIKELIVSHVYCMIHCC